jgi:DNA-binding phage protein
MTDAAIVRDAFDPSHVDFDVFAIFLEARRIHRRKTVNRVAREAEVEREAVLRAARGRNPGSYTFFALCDWIGEEPAIFLKKELRHG